MWKPHVTQQLADRLARATAAAIDYLARSQRPDGSWVPLWFGNQHEPDDENPTYGTARVLLALARIGVDTTVGNKRRAMIGRGVRWLLAAQSRDGGWGGAVSVPPSQEETALATAALAAVAAAATDDAAASLPAARRGAEWLAARSAGAGADDASPIGFYFAKLWYFERAYPLIFTAGALLARP
jgi:squalene-hopene/tetraprenyl-beta-curcumene cyclase